MHSNNRRLDVSCRAELPFVLEAGSMTRIIASVGRCVVCGLEAATWNGEAGRLCDACYQREVRRRIEGRAGVDACVSPGAAVAAPRR